MTQQEILEQIADEINRRGMTLDRDHLVSAQRLIEESNFQDAAQHLDMAGLDDLAEATRQLST